MYKTSAGVVAALTVFALAGSASGQPLMLVSRPCPVVASNQLTPQAPAVQSDVVAVFTSGLRVGTRVTVGLMDNQKLKGEFLGVRDRLLLLRTDGDRPVTLRISFSAIHSIRVRNGGAIARP